MNYKEVKESPVSSGRTNYLKLLDGKKLSYKQAVLAKCFECCCGYVDGRIDCKVTNCPLYRFMPYAKIKSMVVEHAKIDLVGS